MATARMVRAAGHMGAGKHPGDDGPAPNFKEATMDMKIHIDGRIKMCAGCGLFPRDDEDRHCPICGEVRTLDISEKNAAAVGKGLVAVFARSETARRAAA